MTTTTMSWLRELGGHVPDGAVWAQAANRVTRGELRTQVAELERTFASYGIGPRTTVAVLMGAGFTYLWTVFALWLRGAQVMLLDPRLKQAEVDRLLRLCEPMYLVSSGPSGTVRTMFQEQFEIAVRGRRSGRPAETSHCLLQFSSGSTGHPKIIGRTAESLLAEVERFAQIPGMPAAGERVLLGSSLTHSFGLVGGVLSSLNTGASLVFATDARPRTMLRVLHDSAAEVIFGVPFHYDMISRAANPPALSNLRLAVSGGEMLSAEIFDRFEARFGLRIGQAYGMTEVGIVATDLAGVHRPPAVGAFAPGIRAQRRGGELYLYLPESPYVYSPDAGRYADGWLRTHDVCDLDDGVLAVRGRTDSMVVVAGLNVDLTEVEATLMQHEQVTAAVVLLGDTLEAYVGVNGSLHTGELHAWCQERLSHYKVPRRFHLSGQLPRTSNGKLIRNREMLRAQITPAAAPALLTSGGDW